MAKLYRPELKMCDDHWIVTDCQSNDVGFDYDYPSARLFIIQEISEYIAHDWGRRAAGMLWTWPSPGMWLENKWVDK